MNTMTHPRATRPLSSVSRRLVAAAGAFLVASAFAVGCGDDTPTQPTPVTPPTTEPTVTGVTIQAPTTFVEGGRVLVVGETVTLEACASYSDNTEQCGVEATWTSSAPNVATVSGAGLVTGVALGETTISAVHERNTGRATVTVEPAPEPDPDPDLDPDPDPDPDPNPDPDPDPDPEADPESSRVCPANSPTWMGLRVCEESPRSGYDRDAFGTGYSSLEDEIIDNLPKSGNRVYTPYTCTLYDIRSDGTAATDIEHIVALAEAYDSGLAESRFRAFAADLDNLTIAVPTVNRNQKSDRDAGDWGPPENRGWFAARVVAVKQEYSLSVNRAERDALAQMLSSDPSRRVICNGGGGGGDSEGGGGGGGDDGPQPPPVQRFQNCTAMRSAGWNRGVNRNGGTYRASWDDAESRTYDLNTHSDRDDDGHACE